MRPACTDCTVNSSPFDLALPNVVRPGTPGTGKTTTCELVASATGMRYLNVGELVKKEELHNGWDEEFECWVIDEDKVRLRAGEACTATSHASYYASSCWQACCAWPSCCSWPLLAK
jgi:hypothetical protein